MRTLINFILVIALSLLAVSAYATQNDTQSNVLYSPMSDDGFGIGRNSSDKVGFYGDTPVNQPDALSAALTTITHAEPSAEDFAIQDLTSVSPFGFVNANEANTAMKVLKNLQERQAEIEARLEELGLVESN